MDDFEFTRFKIYLYLRKPIGIVAQLLEKILLGQCGGGCSSGRNRTLTYSMTDDCYSVLYQVFRGRLCRFRKRFESDALLENFFTLDRVKRPSDSDKNLIVLKRARR